MHVVLLFNVVEPETFNDDNNVVALFKSVGPDTFNDDNNVVLLLFIIILLVPLTLQNIFPFPGAVKFKFPVPLADTVIGLFGTEASYSGANDEPYTACFAIKWL